MSIPKPLSGVKSFLRWVDEGPRSFLLVVGFTYAITSVFAIGYPEFLGSSAYGWARSLLPIEAWGALMVFISSISVVSAITGNRTVGIIALSMFSWVQFCFGLSILALTLSGTTSAISGSLMWWMPIYFSAFWIKKVM